MAYARLSSSSQCVSFSTSQPFHCRHRCRRPSAGRELTAWPERDRSCNERTLQRPSRRARRQCLLQEWLRDKEWLKDGGNDPRQAGEMQMADERQVDEAAMTGEERMTEEEWMTEEERECAADLMWAERAFKTRRGFKDERRFQEQRTCKDRPRRHRDSRQQPDGEVSPL